MFTKAEHFPVVADQQRRRPFLFANLQSRTPALDNPDGNVKRLREGEDLGLTAPYSRRLYCIAVCKVVVL